MRQHMRVPIPLLTAAAIAALLAGQAAAGQETYTSARDCMRSVTEAERKVEMQAGTVSPEADRLLAQARDLCMQTRYGMVREALAKVAEMPDSQ